MKKNNNIFIIIMALAALFSFYFVKKRIEIEKAYKNFDIVADYNEFKTLGYLYGDSDEFLQKIVDAGANVIALSESTINSLEEDPEINIKTKIDNGYLYVSGDKDIIEFVKEGLKSLKDNRSVEYTKDGSLKIETLPKDLVKFRDKGIDIFGYPAGSRGEPHSYIEYIGLGFYKPYLENIPANAKILLRPMVNNFYQDQKFVIDRYFKAYDELYKNKSVEERVNYLTFAGGEAFMETEDGIVGKFVDELNKRNLGIAVIESSTQRGSLKLLGQEPIVNREDVRKLRMFTTWDYIQREFDYGIPGHQNGEEISNVYFRAISERNIASIMLKPFVKDDRAITDVAAYENVVKMTVDRMEKIGFSHGTAVPMNEWSPRSFMKLPAAFGVSAAVVIFLGILFNISFILKIILFILGIIPAILFFGLGKMTGFGASLYNLGAIIILPTLATCYVLKNYNHYRNRKNIDTNKISDAQIFIKGMIILLVSVVITMVGALYEVSFLASTRDMLELIIFRGVKISQIMPIILSLVVFLYYIGVSRDKVEERLDIHEVGKFLNMNVKFWHAMMGVVALGVLALLLLRGGNTNVKVPGAELRFRNFLENTLPVRPRTKAIFLGYPAVVLLIYLAYKKRGRFLEIFLTILIAIGQADIVNTFSHIRTPILVSFQRIAIEYIVCIPVAILFVLIYKFALKGYDRFAN